MDARVATSKAETAFHTDWRTASGGSPIGTISTQRRGDRLSILCCTAYVCFSNRPIGVKRFQAVQRCSVDVARGLALLFGLGTKALPAWGSKTRWNNLSVGLAVGRSKQTCELTSSIVPRGTSFHQAVELEFPPLVRHCFHAAAAFRVQRNSVPSTQMRCMITARRRARATIALFMPRRLAICIAQALGQDHFVERTNRIWAAS